MKILRFGFVIICIILVLSMSGCADKQQELTVDELISLGDKYLLESNYEQAVVQFLAVIEIEPMNLRGYIGAAEAYVGLGLTNEAIAILEQGLEYSGDSRIQNMIIELQNDNQQEQDAYDDSAIADSESHENFRIAPPEKEPIAHEIANSVDIIKAELRAGNYTTAIVEMHSGTMLSFLKGEKDGSYNYRDEIWDESKNVMVVLSIISFIYDEGDEEFPGNVSFHFFDYEGRDEDNSFSYSGWIDSIISMFGRTTVNYSFWAGDENITYDFNEILGYD